MRCPDCGLTDHKMKCPVCKGDEWPKETMPRVSTEETCAACGGTGQTLRRVAHVCDKCLGIGVIVSPISKPNLKLKD